MKNRNTAMRDALFLQQEGDLIILYEIELYRPHHEGRHYFDMSSPDHTLYPDEDQVVIDDGLPFTVAEIGVDH